MSRRAALLITVAAALILAIAAVVTLDPDEPPFLASDLHIEASLEQVSADEAHAAVQEFASPVDNYSSDVVLGNISWDEPPRPLGEGWLTILLIDQRNFTKPSYIFADAEGGEVNIGSDGVLNKVAERYPWLRGAGDFETDTGWLSVGSTMSVFDDDVTSIEFVVTFPPTAEPLPGTNTPMVPTAPVDMSELLLAMVYIGPDREIYWAERLVG